MKRLFAMILTLFMAITTPLNTLSSVALASGDTDVPTVDELGANQEAMHFIVRHWHSVPVPTTQAQYQEDHAEEDFRYFVIVEGYIVPKAGNAYSYYFIDQKTKAVIEITSPNDSTYISSLSNGTVVLNANPVWGDIITDGAVQHVELEEFSGFSVSTGHNAASTSHDKNDNTIAIQYQKDVHLVKAHAFYANKTYTVPGRELGVATGGNEQIDTQGTGINKYYDNSKGLQTDKTASRHTEKTTVTNPDGSISTELTHDGRTYDLDLEAWYNDNVAVNVGLVLDASGSMGFVSDAMKVIKVANSDIPMTGNTKKQLTSTAQSWNNVFLTDDELANILNRNNTDNSRLGSSGYSYFVFDRRGSVNEFAPLGYWSGYYGNTTSGDYTTALLSSEVNSSVIAVIRYIPSITGNSTTDANNNRGWYYVNPNSSWDLYFGENIETAKVLNGTQTKNGSTVYTDEKIANGSNPLIPSGLTAKDIGIDPTNTKGGTGATYTAPSNTPTKFYIDQDGYLRCFYSTGTSYSNGDPQWGNSYVYQKDDSAYVKVEVLQRALGAFATKLNEESPNSTIAAVRFSTASVPEDALDKLVMLDWTSDPGDVYEMMSMQYGSTGDGFTAGGTRTGESAATRNNVNGLLQYNYGLTGNTSTWTGISSFQRYLSKRTAYNSKLSTGRKYLIIFTDGRDTDDSGNTSQKTFAKRDADALKADGWTIFTVMLTGGTVKASDPDSDYDRAKTFLNTLNGPATDGTSTKADATYFFSTDELQDAGLADEAVSNDKADALARIFTDGILNQIIAELKNYTVVDYIDPRFDLVDANGSVWNLDANGNITVTTEHVNPDDGSVTVTTESKSSGDTIILNRNDDPEHPLDGVSATLFFDSEKKMYYLQWTGQNIPCNDIGADRLNVWHTRITVRAKDDFLGGNSVLTNGNEASMNWLYNPDDRSGTLPSSGIEDYLGAGFDPVKDEMSDYPSKGFPRTTVTAPQPNANVEGEQLIYMGENLTAKEIAKNIEALIRKLKDSESETDKQAYYYWEYLDRYAQATGISIEVLIEKIIAAGSAGYSIEYIYLPNVGGTNQSGTSTNYGTFVTDTAGNVTRTGGDAVGKITYTWNERATSAAPAYPAAPGTTKDKQTYVSTLIANYIPYASEGADRVRENSKLVVETEQRNGQNVPAYSWDVNYKHTEGNAVNGGKVTGTFTTRIVSGEVALQMRVPGAVAAVLQAYMPGQTITYTGKLIRNGDENDVVGTFTAAYNVPAAGAQAKEEIVVAKLALDPAYASYVSKYGLPIGTYSVKTTSKPAANALYKFLTDNPVVIAYSDGDLDKFHATYGDVFAGRQDYPYQYGEFGNGDKVYHDHDFFGDFKATFVVGGENAKLGTDPDRLYTNERYALLEITLSVDGVDVSTKLELHKDQALNDGPRTRNLLTAAAGDTVTYYLTITNTGNNTAINVVINDPIPQGLTLVPGSISDNGVASNGVITWHLGNIPKGESREVSFKVTVPPVTEYTRWLNVATGTYDNPPDGDPGNTPGPDNTPNPDDPDEPGKTPPPPGTPDNPLTSEEVEVEEPVAPRLGLHKDQALNDGERTRSLLTAKAGDTVTYYLTVKNTGIAAAENVVISDQVPIGLTLVSGSISDGGTEKNGVITWRLGNIAAGTERTVSFKVTVPSVTEYTRWKNVATGTYDNPPGNTPTPGTTPGPDETPKPDDPNNPGNTPPPGTPDNPLTSEEVEVEEPVAPSLEIHKDQSLNGGPRTRRLLNGSEGDTVTYYVTVKNTGIATAKNVVVSDKIPAGLNLVSGSISNNGTVSDGVITWRLGDIAAGVERTVSFKVTLPAVTEYTRWKNVATAVYDNPPSGTPGGNTPSGNTPGGNPPGSSGNPLISEEVEVDEGPIIVPMTGDNSHMLLWTALMLLSLLGITMALRKLRVQRQ